jgi:hypothetical protein
LFDKTLISPIFHIVGALVVVVVLKVIWNSRRRKPPVEGFKLVYNYQDGSVHLERSEPIHKKKTHEPKLTIPQ